MTTWSCFNGRSLTGSYSRTSCSFEWLSAHQQDAALLVSERRDRNGHLVCLRPRGGGGVRGIPEVCAETSEERQVPGVKQTAVQFGPRSGGHGSASGALASSSDRLRRSSQILFLFGAFCCCFLGFFGAQLYLIIIIIIIPNFHYTPHIFRVSNQAHSSLAHHTEQLLHTKLL